MSPSIWISISYVSSFVPESVGAFCVKGVLFDHVVHEKGDVSSLALSAGSTKLLSVTLHISGAMETNVEARTSKSTSVSLTTAQNRRLKF